MRIFESFDEAMREIQRDVAKGSKLTFTRVQNKIGLELPGRERVGYSYGINGGEAPVADEVVELGKKLGLKMYQANEEADLQYWMMLELSSRLFPASNMQNPPTDGNHPALKTTFEGKWPSYIYRERMVGFWETMEAILTMDQDSRRAFWPIFERTDSYRAMAPTRIPCSIGYDAMIRNEPGKGPALIFTYLQRSADFDRFFLTDVYFAMQIQHVLAARLEVNVGTFIHNIISLHSFDVEGQEIY